MKPTVKYLPKDLELIQTGRRAMVWPIDHPSPLVSNTKAVFTSEVISYDKDTGEFETMNSKYVPVPPESKCSCGFCECC